MGTWGHQPFDNDAASDVVYDVEAAESWDDFSELFDECTEALGEEGGEEAVALAAMVAASHGRAKEMLSDEATAAIARLDPAPKAVVAKARKAVERVLDRSDLKARWEEAGAKDWEAATRKLLDELAPLDGGSAS